MKNRKCIHVYEMKFSTLRFPIINNNNMCAFYEYLKNTIFVLFTCLLGSTEICWSNDITLLSNIFTPFVIIRQ